MLYVKPHVFISLYTIQIVSKQLHFNYQENMGCKSHLYRRR